MKDTTLNAVLIEDDKEIRRFVSMALQAEGFSVWEAETAARGLIEAGTRKPDLIVLDLGLPDRDGVELVRDIRTWSGTPILILSARSEESQKVLALDAGADDYLTKPFGVPELLARIRALLRRLVRNEASGKTLVSFGKLQVDLTERSVRRDGEIIHLTPTEYRMLTVLISQSGRVLTHRQLLKEVWGPSHVDQSNYLRVFMAGLRRKLEEDAAQPKYLLTESGVGYRLMI